MTKNKKRRSVTTKAEVVLRLLKGEDMELVSRETGYAMHELQLWREKFLSGGREHLKSHPTDLHDKELESRDKLISKLALENEILKKARAISKRRKS